MKHIGYFIEPFDPPHAGQLHTARAAASALRLEKVLLIPSPQTDETAADLGQRMQMLMLAVAGESTLEAEMTAVPYCDCERVLLAREDDLPALTKSDDIRFYSEIALLPGKNPDRTEQISKTLREQGIAVTIPDIPAQPVFSADVRRMLGLHCDTAWLCPAVMEYIRIFGLYGIQENLKGLSAEALEKSVVRLLKPSRVAHVLGCRDAAVKLARRWGVDTVQAERSALLHDITKALPDTMGIEFCKFFGQEPPRELVEHPQTLHAFSGSIAAEKLFGEDAAVCDAIRCHTTGKINMSPLDKVLYLADLIEPTRQFTVADNVRAIAYSDLDGAVMMALEESIRYLEAHGIDPSGASAEALHYLKSQKENRV